MVIGGVRVKILKAQTNICVKIGFTQRSALLVSVCVPPVGLKCNVLTECCHDVASMTINGLPIFCINTTSVNIIIQGWLSFHVNDLKNVHFKVRPLLGRLRQTATEPAVCGVLFWPVWCLEYSRPNVVLSSYLIWNGCNTRGPDSI